MEWNKVKTIEDCIEEATVDTYCDEEAATGWLTCIEEIFRNIKEVNIFGEPTKLLKFDLFNNDVIAVCEKNKKRIKLTLDSMELIKPTKVQRLWIDAYIKFRNN